MSETSDPVTVFNQEGGNFELLSETWPVLAIYIVWLGAYIGVSEGFFRFDYLGGITRMGVAKQRQATEIKSALIVSGVVGALVPILIAIAWGVTLRLKGFSTVPILANVFDQLFFTFLIVGVLQWKSTRYVELGWPILTCFGIAAFCCWCFALVVASLPNEFSFTSCTATLLTINFLPACYGIY